MGSVARGKAWLTLVCALFELFVVGRLLYDVKDGDGELGFGQGEGLGVGRRGVRLRICSEGSLGPTHRLAWAQNKESVYCTPNLNQACSVSRSVFHHRCAYIAKFEAQLAESY